MINHVAPQEPEATFDQSWADRVTKETQDESHRLEQQLKGYKNNLIKESIRVGHPCPSFPALWLTQGL